MHTLVLFFVCIVNNAFALPVSPHAEYHNTDALLIALRGTAFSCQHASARWAAVTPLSFPVDSPQLSRVLVITVSANLSTTPSSVLQSRPSFLASFGEHARERITSELALVTLRHLCSNPPAILARVQIILLPLVNAAGRRFVEAGDACRRANAASVDPNRNFAWRWGVRDKDTRQDEEQPGPHPLSEPESRVLDAVAGAVGPVAYMSVHSGGLAVITPWDHGGAAVSGLIKELGIGLARRHCGGCPVGNAAETFGYRAYGTGADHVYGVIGVPFVYTLEIYDDDGAREDECERMFNPVTRGDFDMVMRNWSRVLVTVAEQVLGIPKRRWPTSTIGIPVADVQRWRSGYRVIFTDDEYGIRLNRFEQIRTWWGCTVLVVLFTVALIGLRRRKSTGKKLVRMRVKGSAIARLGSWQMGRRSASDSR